MQTIEHYCDYRKYLQDFYDERKKKHRFFTYRYFCKKAGLTSTGLYSEVVSGKRNLTGATISAFIRGLGLKEKESAFFRALVHFNQAKSAGDKQKYLEEMRNLLPKLKEEIVPIHYYSYYSKWQNIVIRELACEFPWNNDYLKLAKAVRPSISKGEAREAVELLLSIGFLKRQENGSYIQARPHITTEQEVVSLSVRGVNHQFSKLGMDAIHAFPPSERDISSLAMGLSKENYQVIKQEIIGFKDRIKRIIANQKKVDAVYNLNVQFFPVSEFFGTEEAKG